MFNSKMIIYWGVTRCSCQAFIIPVRNVFSIFLYIFFRKTEINYVNFWAFLISTKKEILGFYIPVQKLFIMHELKSINNLKTNHDCRFQIENFPTFLKELLKRRAKQFLHHNVIVVVFPKIINCWETIYICTSHVQIS